MNENAKKGLLIGIIVVAVIAVGFSVMNAASADKPQVVKTVTMPPGYKSEKQLANEAAKNGGTPPAKGGEERDLGG